MASFEKIEGETGLFEVRKVKVLYEIISFENYYIKKNLDTEEREVIVKNGNKRI